MTLEHLIAFNAVLILSILSPGAAFLMAVRSSVSNGRRAGIATGFGLLEIAFYTACAFILSAPAARTRYLRAKPFLDRTAALILGGLGLKLLLQR